MTSHRALDDQQFITAFRDGSLPAALFNHEAHLRLAFLYIRTHGVAAATEAICLQLKEYVSGLGAAGKFNATLTIAAIQIVHHFMCKAPEKNFYALLQSYPRLSTAFRHLVEQHYSMDIFANDAARQTYIPPDRLPFEA